MKLNKNFGGGCSRKLARSTTIPNLPTPLPASGDQDLEKEDLLSTVSVAVDFQKIMGLMEGEIGVLQVEKRIPLAVRAPDGEDTQRSTTVEQMKAIQRELGDGEELERGDRARRAH